MIPMVNAAITDLNRLSCVWRLDPNAGIYPELGHLA
jgi:hypothetical protein